MVPEVASKLGITEEQAKALIQKATDDPVRFEQAQNMLKVMRQTKERKVIKGVQLRHVRQKIGRNDPCPNHPNIKFKKCECFKAERVIGVIAHELNKTAQ